MGIASASVKASALYPSVFKSRIHFGVLDTHSAFLLCFTLSVFLLTLRLRLESACVAFTCVAFTTGFHLFLSLRDCGGQDAYQRVRLGWEIVAVL